LASSAGAVTVMPLFQSCELPAFLACRAVCREWLGASPEKSMDPMSGTNDDLGPLKTMVICGDFVLSCQAYLISKYLKFIENHE